MTVIYVDSSIIVSILLNEAGSKNFRKKMKKAQELISASLLEAEIYSVACREKINLKEAALFLDPISLFIPDKILSSEYNLIFSHGYCGGADAFHLACALYLDPSRKDLTFLTVDRKQQKIASNLGFKTN